MYIIISPSKTQDFTQNFPKGTNLGMIPIYNTETKKLAKIMKDFSAQDLGEMMHVSDKLADLSYGRFQKWSGIYKKRTLNNNDEYNFSPALFAFKGDVYKGFDLNNYVKKDFLFAEKHLGIVSGFYGLLSPLSYMKPYRLEMGTKMQFEIAGKSYKNLYEFWQEKITNHINNILRKEKVLLNLASNEYSKVIDRKKVEGRIIDVAFKIKKGSEYKTIAIYAKHARGEMANWIIQNHISDSEKCKHFAESGWRYSKKLSTDNELTFTKNK